VIIAVISLGLTAAAGIIVTSVLAVMLLLSRSMLITWQPHVLHDALGVCKCGQRIWGNQNWKGVPSTWVHVRDGRHLHDDGSWVELR
jgi:hypothetical protein